MQKPILYTDLARYYDLIYSWKDYRKEAATIRRLIAKYKKSKGNDLLEVGCGTGRHMQHLKNKFRVLGTDISAGMLSLARKNVKGVRFQRADMVTLNLGREFDVIICLWNVLGHIQTTEERLLTLTKARKLLTPEGVMFVDVNHRYNAVVHGWSRTLWNMLSDYFFWSDTNGDIVVSWKIGSRPVCTHGHLFTERELEALFQSTGFTIKKEWILNYRTGAVCKSSLQGSLLYQLESSHDEACVPVPRAVWGETALALRKY